MRSPFSFRAWSLATVLALLVVVLSAGVISGCGKEQVAVAGNPAGQHGGVMNATDPSLRSYTGTDMAGLKGVTIPSFVSSDIQDAYQFAVAHPEVLQYVPCYCGCGMHSGHRSNLNCYIDGVRADGTVQWDNHATQCVICVEITRDAKALKDRGASLKEIRAYVDSQHSEKGPGTDTPMPPA